MKTRAFSEGGTRRSWGTINSMTKWPPETRCAAAFENTAICSSCVVTFMIEFATT